MVEIQILIQILPSFNLSMERVSGTGNFLRCLFMNGRKNIFTNGVQEIIGKSDADSHVCIRRLMGRI